MANIFYSDFITTLCRRGEVSVRLANICRYHYPEIKTVEQLSRIDLRELKKRRNCGKRTIAEVESLLESARQTMSNGSIGKRAILFSDELFMKHGYSYTPETAYIGYMQGHTDTMDAVITVLRATGYFDNEEGLSEEVMIDQFKQCVDDRFKD